MAVSISGWSRLVEAGFPFQIDRLYGYESSTKKDIWLHMTSQSSNTQMEFKDRYEAMMGEFAEQVRLSWQSLLS
jgi:hypothetical protein